jgi:hypothetical protein
MSIACQNRVQVLVLSIEDSKKLADDIELQNHWHTVLAHRATAQSPLLISTWIFVFFWVLHDTQAMRTLSISHRHRRRIRGNTESVQVNMRQEMSKTGL